MNGSDEAGPQSSKPTPAVGFLEVAVAGFVLGSLLTCGLGNAWLNGSFRAWERVPTPEGHTVVKLLPSNTLTLVAETEDGTVFARHATGHDWMSSETLDTTWREISYYSGRQNGQARWDSCNDPDGSSSGGWRVRMPLVVVDHIYCQWGHFERADSVHFVLQRNGEILTWSWGRSGFQGLFVLASVTVGGALLGPLLGVAVMAVVRARNKRRALLTLSDLLAGTASHPQKLRAPRRRRRPCEPSPAAWAAAVNIRPACFLLSCSPALT